MQAVGVLKLHQEDLPGHPWLPPEPAKRRWLLTYRLHAGRAEEDKRPCGVGAGQNRTEETNECLDPPETGTTVIHGHSGRPCPPQISQDMWPGPNGERAVGPWPQEVLGMGTHSG